MKKLDLNEPEIIELYNSGLSCKKIANINNCSECVIKNRLKKNGIKLHDNTYYRRINTFNENFFENIDTEKKSYWLGFLYADGNIYRYYNSYYIKLSVCDLEIIESFKRDLNASYKISQRTDTLHKRPIYSITISSKKMGLDLIKHGCIPRKSLTLKFPTTIPKYLHRHFIRGYFDGDGCVTVFNKKYFNIYNGVEHNYEYIRIGINICGTFEFLSKLRDIIGFGKVSKEKRRTSNCWRLESQNSKKIRKLYNYLYYKSTTHLNRKFQKFKNFYNKDVHRL